MFTHLPQLVHYAYDTYVSYVFPIGDAGNNDM